MENPVNQILVIFGASGDLTSRKLIPALYSLKIQNLLPARFAIIGVGRTHFSESDFRKKMEESLLSYSEEKPLNDKKIGEFLSIIYYISMDYTLQSDFERLKVLLEETEKSCNTESNYVFDLAIPPLLYEVIARNLSVAGLMDQSNGFRRLIIEKPFGYDLESGKRLNRDLHDLMDERQIYRIDHYLGKETVQNLLVTRFANGIFEPLWNRNYVHRVEITAAESIGVEDRGGYYDSAGALRDMVPNHLLQMVALTAMEPPSSLEPEYLRGEILKVFHSLQPLKEEDILKQVVKGQYTGSIVRGECIPGYRHEKGVAPDSKTETFVAVKFFIDNWRWGGVPFYIRTGKRMPTRVTEIVIHFKRTPHRLFQHSASVFSSNMLIIRIQPNEGILLKFDMKEPGAGFNTKNVNMDFLYKDLTDIRIPSAYERLLNDVMIGDSTLFSRASEVEMAWKFVEPIQKAWENDAAIKVYGYPAGTWGPRVSDDLIGGCGMTWRYPCKNLTDDGLYCEL